MVIDEKITIKLKFCIFVKYTFKYTGKWYRGK